MTTHKHKKAAPPKPRNRSARSTRIRRSRGRHVERPAMSDRRQVRWRVRFWPAAQDPNAKVADVHNVDNVDTLDEEGEGFSDDSPRE